VYVPEESAMTGYMLDGAPVGNIARESLPEIWNSPDMRRMRELHVSGRAGEIDICSRCCIAIPHPMLVAGSLILHGKTVRRMVPWVERLAYFSKAPKGLLRPPQKSGPAEELVQISTRGVSRQ
jgi:hypothetical protein